MSTSTDGDVLSIAAADGRSSRKLAVLNAAIALFAERGYDRVSVRDIGERLDLTGPSLYRHYKSKSDLLADAVSLVIRPLISRLREISDSAGSADERLEEAIAFHVSFALRHRVYLQVYYREAHHLPEADRRTHRRRASTYRTLWTNLILAAGAAPDRQEADVLYGMLMAMLNVGVPGNVDTSAPWLGELVAARASAMMFGV
jgi:AcrR family transcriptional regulator